MGKLTDESRKHIENLRLEKKRAQTRNNVSQEAKICDELGCALSLEGRHEEAVEEHVADLQLRESLADVLGQAVANRRIGECYCELRQFKQALRYLNEYLRLSRECYSSVEEQRALATLGRMYLIQAEDPNNSCRKTRRCRAKAEDAFSKSLEACDSLGDDVSARELGQMKAGLHLNLGLLYEQIRALSTSAQHLQESAKLARLHNLDEDLFNAQTTLTLTLMKMSREQWPEADKTASSALTTANLLKKRPQQAEAHLLTAKVKVQLMDFRSAKKSLKKAHRLAPKQADSADGLHKQQIMEFLVQIVKLERLHQRVATESDPELRIRLTERMADLAASYSLYQLALTLYSDTLDLCREAKKPTRVLEPLMYSLGQTYSDDGQYDEAVVFYRQELDCQSDQHDKACRTLLRIADEQEKADKDYDVIRDTYLQAIHRAQQAMNGKLEALSLLSLTQLNTVYDRPGLSDKARLENVLEEYNLGVEDLSDEEDSQGKDSDEADADEDDDDIAVDLDDISDSDGEEEFDRGTQTRCRRQPRGFTVKRNEKGESPLHTACIQGNIKKVRALLDKGHPVDVQDYCGWTPLHEACNHGYLEIVDLLLNTGADINDPGGPLTEGTTPLHDACAAGNVEVIELLVDRGASVSRRNKKCKNALSELEAYCARTEPSELPAGQIEAIRRVQAVLYRATTGKELRASDYVFSSQIDDDLPSFTKSSRKRQVTCSDDVTSSSDSDSDNNNNYRPLGFSSGRDAIPEPGTAKDVYRTTIKSMGSSAQRHALKISATSTQTAPQKKKAQSALVDDDVVQDDWMIHDVVEPIKRRAVDIDRLLPSEPKKRRTDKSCKSTGKKSSIERDGLQKSNLKPGRLDTWKKSNLEPDRVETERVEEEKTEWSSDDEISFLHIFDEDDNDKLSSDRPRATQTKMTSYTEPLLSSGSSGYDSSSGVSRRTNRSLVDSVSDLSVRDQRSGLSRHQSGPCRFKVRVDQHLLVVPVTEPDRSRTIDWLCDQTANRYSQKHGRRPKLSLQTIDGASLAGDDVISDVVQPDEELVAVLEGWVERSLCSKYEDACSAACTVAYMNIKAVLKECSQTQHLLLSDLGLRMNQLSPVMTALQQSRIHTLKLNGNRLEGSMLIDLVSGLSGLSVLDVSSNLLDHTAVCNLVTGLSKSPARMTLRSLSLSYNSLTDDSAEGLLDLVETCPHLVELAMACCRFTHALFTVTPALEAAFHRSQLERLDVSCNRFGRRGLRSLINALPTNVKTLNVARTLTSDQQPDLSDELRRLMTQCGQLEDVDLSACHLSREELSAVISSLPQCSCLTGINLSNNPLLDSALTRLLLENSLDHKLHSISLVSCGLEAPLDSDLMDCIISKLGCAQPMKKLNLTCRGLTELDSNSLVQIWTTVWSDKARSRVRGDNVSLWVQEEL